MENITYHRVIPENLKDAYVEFDQVDFNMDFKDRALVLGSVRLEGEVRVTKGGATLETIPTQQINLDGMVGAHSFVENYTTSIKGGSIIENITEYPRYAKMAMTATAGRSDMNNSNNVCELKAPLDDMTNQMLQGVVPKVQPGVALRLDPDFSIKPLICLNSGAGNLSEKKTGPIRLSLQLVRNNGALFGNDMDATVSYELRNLRLRFTSVPDEGSGSVVLKTKLNIKQSLQSSFSNIQTKVPAVCTAVSVSFQEQANENTATNNNLALDKVPNLSQTQFLFNDSTNTLITYQIKNVSEVLQRYIDSFMDTGRNFLSLQNLANNNGFGIGLDLGQAIDLSNQKFSLQVDSDLSSATPLIAYMYFHSFIEM